MKIQRTVAAAVAAATLSTLVVALTASAAVGDITTVAGTGAIGYSGNGGLATSAEFGFIYGIEVDAAGNLFIADIYNSVIRKVDHTTGIVTNIAGTGSYGYSGDGAAATGADFTYTYDVAVSAAGDLYIADHDNHMIRMVDHATGFVSVVAGTGIGGYSGDGAAATAATLNGPSGVSLNAAGDLYITDNGNNVVRRVDHLTGFISTVAGTGAVGYSGDGAAATAATLSYPMDAIADAAGDLYITDYGNNVVRRVDHLTGFISTVAGTGAVGYSGDGAAATAATFGGMVGYLDLDGAGNLYIPDFVNNVVRRVDHLTGLISTVAGTGIRGRSGDAGPALAADLGGPWAVAVNAAGDLFIGENMRGGVRKVSGLAVPFSLPVIPPDGLPATGASTDGLVWIALVMLAAGAVLVAAQRRTQRVR